MTHFIAKVGNRTPDLFITSELLYRLSYFGRILHYFLHYNEKKQ